ncbi:MAG: sensor histidine kinase [Christensenellales bacterium]
MTIKKQLILMIGAMVLLAVLVQSVISTGYIDRAFSNQVAAEYNKTVERIKEQAVDVLQNNSGDSVQAKKTFGVYLTELIGQISVLDSGGQAVVSVQDAAFAMRGRMMRRLTEETDYFDLEKDGTPLGTLVIVRTSSVQASETVKLFKRTLLKGSLIAGAAVLLISVAIIAVVSSKMSRDLRRTAEYAKSVDTEPSGRIAPSKITEIRLIQAGLENLAAKLRLQKRARQEKIDALSHEVRTPLAILKTNCEGALDKVVVMDDARLESCLTEIDHLTSILSGIADVIEYTDGQPVVHKETFSLGEMLEKIVRSQKLPFDKKGVALSLGAMKHIEMNSDRNMIAQAVYNLLTNACKFTPAGGQTEVTAQMSGGSVTIEVRDSGPGIPQEDMERIFEAYQRGSNADDSAGDGLGLYIASRNIEALGGKIVARNMPKGGASFTIVLPL